MWEPWPFLALIQEPATTHAAEELAGVDRLWELLFWGNRSRFHAGQRTRVLRHQHQAPQSTIRLRTCIQGTK